MLVVKSTYQPGYARLEEFLAANGRETLLAPLYVELMKTPAGETLAKRVYRGGAADLPGAHGRGPRGHRDAGVRDLR